jgi:hypothetical protein
MSKEPPPATTGAVPRHPAGGQAPGPIGVPRGLVRSPVEPTILVAAHRDALHGIGRGDVMRMLDMATTTAALACARPGAGPPTLRELRAVIEGDDTPVRASH